MESDVEPKATECCRSKAAGEPCKVKLAVPSHEESSYATLTSCDTPIFEPETAYANLREAPDEAALHAESTVFERKDAAKSHVGEPFTPDNPVTIK